VGNFLFNIGQSLLSIGIKKALLGAGLGLASYAGLSTMLDNMITSAVVQMQGGSAVALAFLGMSGMDTALSMVMSAVLVRATIFGASLSLVKT
jgi:hypothetical protein